VVSVIYHVATAGDWERARREGRYTVSTRGVTLDEQGFIHASTGGQVAWVANRYYRGVPDLVVLVIDTDRVAAEIRYEEVPGSEAPFPHIYGALNTDAVIGTRPLRPGSDGGFTFDAAGLPEVAAYQHVQERDQGDQAEQGPDQLPHTGHVVAREQVDPHEDHGQRVDDAHQEFQKLLHDGTSYPGPRPGTRPETWFLAGAPTSVRDKWF
jgi:uncharacterized protein (DUF952 family)